MLTRFDDYPVHQTPDPIAQPASSDRNVYDRYFFNGYAPDGEFYFGFGMGLYPNRGIIDCAFSIARGAEQHAFHASGRAPAEPSQTRVGPVRIEVLEPMRSTRLVIEPNETGIDCDLTFTPRTACLDEGRQTLRVESRLVMDTTRFAQFGRWQGEVRYPGETLVVDSATVHGTKDRSWGIRPVGEPESAGAPSGRSPQIFFLWTPLHFEDRCVHFSIFEDEAGQPWHWNGAILPAYTSPDSIPGVEDPETEHLTRVEHGIRYQRGTRRAESAEFTLLTKGGERHRIEVETLLCFQMKGLGYTHPQWGHGRWQGELVVDAESWRSADLDPLAMENQHIQQVVRARWGDREGVGVMEQLCFGPHATYGFKELLDGAA